MKLVNLILQNIECFDLVFTDIYLFGSVLVKKSPNDIDILLLYNSQDNHVRDIIERKNCSINKLTQFISLDIDCVVMSYLEYEKYNFIENTLIYKKIR